MDDFRRALTVEPGHFNATLNLAKLLSRAERHAEAIDFYARALAKQSESPEIRIALAYALAEVDKFDDAKRHFHRAMLAMPGSASPFVALGHLMRRCGRFDDAYASYLRARDLEPENCAALIGILQHPEARIAADEFARIARLADDPTRALDARSHLHFVLSQVEERAGNYDTAFQHMEAANALRRKELEPVTGPYDPQQEAARVDRIIESFGEEYFSRTASFGLDSELPIFVVGMPRSGTTLCEQILASHSRVFGAGEIPDIEMISRDLQYGGSSNAFEKPGLAYATRLTEEGVRSVAECHLARLQKLAPDAARVVDKVPMNYYHLGLIATLFPRAKIVLCRRDPMDTGLSCYSKDFARMPPWATDLWSIGHVHRQHDRLMDHWKRVLPIRLLELGYEALVTDFEPWARRLVEYVGLEWDRSCLEFNRTTRQVKTASLEQVRRPLYSSSIGRWRNFAHHLEPLRAGLRTS
jgi:tetratricopeptide (TPR) repeat protein